LVKKPVGELLAGAVGRDDVDEGGRQRRHRDHPQDDVARAPGDVDGGRHGDDQDQRPERPEGVVELGEEPFAVDRRLTQVVGDGEARPWIERHLVGAGQFQRPEADLRDRVAAGLDRRPHVPVATDDEGREPQHPGRGETSAAAAERTTPIVIATTGTRNVVLTEPASPAAIPAMISGLVEQRRVARARPGRPLRRRLRWWPLIRKAAKAQEGESHDVVAPSPGWVSIITPRRG
jgi:hypothetical protein